MWGGGQGVAEGTEAEIEQDSEEDVSGQGVDGNARRNYVYGMFRTR